MKQTVLSLLVTAGLFLTGCQETPTSGSAIYARSCGTCHGVELGGGVAGPLTAGSAAAARSDAEYLTIIREGTTGMPANRNLNDAQLEALIAYIRGVQTQ